MTCKLYSMGLNSVLPHFDCSRGIPFSPMLVVGRPQVRPTNDRHLFPAVLPKCRRPCHQLTPSHRVLWTPRSLMIIWLYRPSYAPIRYSELCSLIFIKYNTWLHIGKADNWFMSSFITLDGLHKPWGICTSRLFNIVNRGGSISFFHTDHQSYYSKAGMHLPYTFSDQMNGQLTVEFFPLYIKSLILSLPHTFLYSSTMLTPTTRIYKQ